MRSVILANLGETPANRYPRSRKETDEDEILLTEDLHGGARALDIGMPLWQLRVEIDLDFQPGGSRQQPEREQQDKRYD